MPYIDNDCVENVGEHPNGSQWRNTDWENSYRRDALKNASGYEFDGDGRARTAGELSFKFACDIDQFVREAGWSYQTANDVVGALDGLKHEFQRRFVDPYEDHKREVNGEVFQGVIATMNKQAVMDGVVVVPE